MTSQMGSSVAPARPGSAPAVRLAGRAVTSAILTYFGLIVTKGGAFAKGSCRPWLTRPAKRLPRTARPYREFRRDAKAPGVAGIRPPDEAARVYNAAGSSRSGSG